MRFPIKKLVRLAFLVCIGLVLQAAEAMVPAFDIIPGGKLGLANVSAMAAVYFYGGKEGFIVALLRSFAGCFFGGGMAAVPYSVSGALLSWAVITFLYKYAKKLSWSGISMTAAAAHNTAQISVAAVLLSNVYVYTYLPPLLILSIVSGTATGIVFANTVKFLPKKNIKA